MYAIRSYYGREDRHRPSRGKRGRSPSTPRSRGCVRRLPDKAEAWYLYGDYLVHGAWRVAEDDWFERAREAFERAAALDPGLEVVKQHKMFQIGFAGDTVGLRVITSYSIHYTKLYESGRSTWI